MLNGTDPLSVLEIFMKIGVIGKGKAGGAIGSGLSLVGHEVKYGHRDPKEPVEEAASGVT